MPTVRNTFSRSHSLPARAYVPAHPLATALLALVHLLRLAQVLLTKAQSSSSVRYTNFNLLPFFSTGEARTASEGTPS